MYFPVGWPKALAVPPEDIGGLHSVLCNRDRVLFAVVTERSLAIWYCRPCVQIVCHCRSEESVRTQGTNQRAAWRPDSTSVAVTTSQGHILFYHLEREVVAGHGANCYNQTRGGRFPSMRSSSSMEYGEGVPSIRMTFVTSVQIIGKIECLVCVRDELLVATGNGMLQRLRWDGVVNGKTGINIASIPFSVDLQHSRASTLDTPGITFTHIEYSGLMGGFAVVLPDGRAGLVNTLAGKVENNSLQGVWAQGLENVTCVAVNNRYRLIAFGCTDGLGVVYTVDDMTGALQVSHRLELSTKDYPDACMACGPVSRLRWSPDGCVLAMAWDRGGMAIWSVYGALLMCTLGADQGLYQESLRLHLFRIKSMCWSMEGYQLWMACETLDRSEVMELPTATSELLQLQFVKSTLTVNPCATNHEHLFLQGEDKLFINTGDLVMKQQWKDANMNRPLRESIAGSNTSSPQKPSRQSNILVGNKQWLVIQIPITYLGSNWPIRYAAIDRTGFCIAVAGRCGLAHYAMFTRKWKLFGNETQEKDMVVTGGLTWWRDFIICACYNLNENRDELRMYPRASNLDNAFAYSCKVPSQILLLNLFRDMLVVFCADCHIALYSIERRDANPSLSIGFGVMDPSASLTLLQEISLASYIPHAVTVISVTLTSLRTETASSKQTSSRREAESLIVNVAGRLLMLQRDRSMTSGKENGDIRKREKMLPFCAPVVLASCVENMWSSSRSSPDKVHLSEALWLGCGAAGMKVWLPLFPRNDEKRHSFLSKRIMLPFQLNIYPLAVLFEDAVVLGAANDTMKYDFQDCSSPSALDSTPTRLFPFNVVDRTTQVYLHHIVRELLRRNLGSHALQIAKSCRSLPYFSHVLELLLHQVLEEEATASEPIPDPLLPRIVDFIREFPEFLQTIVHCARKTEIALWSYLFASAGNPKDLFEQCLQSGSLETASSYLIILQNLEPAAISRQHATLLLDASLDKGKWELAKDLVRFLRAIGNEDPESPPRTPVNPINAPMYPLPPPPQDGPFPGFAFGSQARPVRSYSMGENLAGVRERGSVIERERERERHHSVQATSTTNKKTTAAPKDIPPRADCGVFMGTLKHLEETAEHFFIDVILQRHARKLLSAGRLRELGSFAAHLNFELIGWLQKERCRAARVDDFVTSLHTLHRDFQWPMPVIALSQVLSRSNSGERSRSSSYEALEVGVNGMTLSDISEGPNRLRPNGMYASPSLRSSMDLLCDELRQEALDSRQFNSNQKGDNGSTAATETSEMSASIVADDSELTLDDSMWNLANLDELEALSQELACRGPPHCETQLRYLLHVMMEAGCLEWAMLISLVLRDSMGVTRVVNTASLTDMPIDIVGRMREGLSYLELWADTECPGYKPFLLVIRGQAEVLTGIVDIQGSPQVTPIPTPESSLTSADFHALGFHGNSSDKEDPEEQKSVVETDLPQDGGQCALS